MMAASAPLRSAGTMAWGNPMNVGWSASSIGKYRVRAYVELRIVSLSGIAHGHLLFEQGQGKASARSSSGRFDPPTGKATYCLPPAMYVIGAPPAFAGSGISARRRPVALSYAYSLGSRLFRSQTLRPDMGAGRCLF